MYAKVYKNKSLSGLGYSVASMAASRKTEGGKRMYTIQELRAMHKLSKPEFKKAIEKANRVANTEVMSKEATHVITALVMACESYDEVIDQLFNEIDRLNSMMEKMG